MEIIYNAPLKSLHTFAIDTTCERLVICESVEDVCEFVSGLTSSVKEKGVRRLSKRKLFYMKEMLNWERLDEERELRQEMEKELERMKREEKMDEKERLEREEEEKRRIMREYGRVLVLGGGSDVLFTKPFEGTIVIPRIMGIKVVKEGMGFTDVCVGAGVLWDDFVKWSCERDLWGIESLSGIPGCVGAAPVQNPGAYGSEAGSSIKLVEAVDMKHNRIRLIRAWECHFDYRDSRFKHEWSNRFIITRVTFRLRKRMVNLESARFMQGVTTPSAWRPSLVREEVLKLRAAKLPDPNLIPNGGSFFKNPIVTKKEAAALRKRFPDMPIYEIEPRTHRRSFRLNPSPSTESHNHILERRRETNGLCKLSAGWLIESCGWKGRVVGRVGVYEKHALILVNLDGGDGAEIEQLASEIQESVLEKFNVHLEPEVHIF